MCTSGRSFLRDAFNLVGAAYRQDHGSGMAVDSPGAASARQFLPGHHPEPGSMPIVADSAYEKSTNHQFRQWRKRLHRNDELRSKSVIVPRPRSRKSWRRRRSRKGSVFGSASVEADARA